MIIDTHCHYNLLPENSWLSEWEKAQQHGVVGSVVVGVAEIENTRAVSIAESNPNLFAAIGFHPENYVVMDVDQIVPDIDQHMASLTMSISPQTIAVGEVGLDYFRLPTSPEAQLATRDLQKAALTAQIAFAEERNLPLILHVRDQAVPESPTPDNAYWDLLDLLRLHHAGHQPFILHCVSGPLSYVKAALEMGAYIGVAGNVTYKNADHIRQLVTAAPPDRLLLETDAPFLPPVPHRGKACEPWMISLTAQYLHQELHLDLHNLYQNTLTLFPQFDGNVT